MQAILLAAGTGSRLGLSYPKVLLQLDGRSLLQRHIRCLEQVGIDRLLIVTGHQRDVLMAAVHELAPPFKVTEIHNTNYRQGSTISLLMALAEVDTAAPVLIMDADVLYDPALMTRLTSAPGNALLVDPDFDPGPEPVKVCVQHGRIVEFDKVVSADINYDLIGESVGFFKVLASEVPTLTKQCQATIAEHGQRSPHERALRDAMVSGAIVFECLPTSGLPWLEIDFPEDIERARNEVLIAIDEPG